MTYLVYPVDRQLYRYSRIQAMGVRKTHIQVPGYYFITFTNYKWLPLFELCNAYDLVYRWFDSLRRGGHRIVAYVIMPNHVHLMLAYKESGQSINTLVGNGKRLMAYAMIRRLQIMQQAEILDQLAAGVPEGGRGRGKQHAVFRPSFHLQHCYSQQFILQKLRYIHNNPCAKKWTLAASPVAYRHSSAAFYESGIPGPYPVTSWQALEAGAYFRDRSAGAKENPEFPQMGEDLLPEPGEK